jgi:serine/threonine-protein kinase
MMAERLDRFELIAELASGGMGTVFLARLGGAGGFQRLYAIKRLHEHLAKHPEFIEMFMDEARLAASIHHPNVVSILEIGAGASGHYLVMEYIEGDTAAQLFLGAAQDHRKVPMRVILRIVVDVLAGLHAAHDRSDDDGRPLEIVHRDVSPHNILVGVDGVSRITDFGIARAATRLAVTRSGQLKGKLAYMAPEQARSEKIDRRADVFAMGICLWEMLTGERLFKAEGEGETLNRVLYEPIPTPRGVDPDVPPEIEDVCMKALTRDPDARFATAVEFADALEKAGLALDLLGSHREVAACVKDIMGQDLSERRAGLRAWIGDTERRNMMPSAAESSGELGSGPQGAMVSVYVPPLLDSGMLAPHADGSRMPARSRRGSGGLRFALVAVVVVSVSLGVLKWLRSAPSVSASAATSPATAPPAPLPSSPSAATLAQAASAEPRPADAPSPPPGMPSVAPAPPSPPASSEKAQPQARAPRPAPPPRPQQANGSGAATTPPPEMQVNPYR